MQCNNQSAVFCKNRLGGICSIARNCFQLKHANVGAVTPTLLWSLLVFSMGVKKRGFYFNSNQWFSFVAFLLFFQQKKSCVCQPKYSFSQIPTEFCATFQPHIRNRKMDHSNFEYADIPIFRWTLLRAFSSGENNRRKQL